MFHYYLKLGVRNLRRNPVLTALMIVTLAIGVAASVSTLTILHVMSGNPIPHKSERLVVPVIDNGLALNHTPGARPPDAKITYKDAENLLRAGFGKRRTAMYDVLGAVEPARRDMPVVEVRGIAAGGDLFAMFDIPFLHGGGWSAQADKAGSYTVVLSRKTSEKLFGTVNPVGQKIRLFSQEFEVTGVLDTWNPVPRFVNVLNASGGSFSGEEDIYVPLQTAVNLQVPSNGGSSCMQGGPGRGFEGRLQSECTWIQFWYELDSSSQVADLRSHLDGYTAEQKKLGRFERTDTNRVYDVMEWLDYLQIVRSDSKVTVWLAFGFLMLCLVNTMGLLLAKFSVRASEVGVRRALGATRRTIFAQFLIETGVIGIAGGALGLVLSLAALWAIGLQSKEMSAVASMDWMMLVVAIALAIGASILAGLLPTWRACQVTPAIQLKSQ
ncbi:MAG TPA: ABC transporter permease [Burkholderiaceae bacterium]